MKNIMIFCFLVSNYLFASRGYLSVPNCSDTTFSISYEYVNGYRCNVHDLTQDKKNEETLAPASKVNPEDLSVQDLKKKPTVTPKEEISLEEDKTLWDKLKEKIKMWEGKCGQIAAANVVSNLCKRAVSAVAINSLASDLTPGSKSSTLRKYFNAFTHNEKTETRCPVLYQKTLLRTNAKNEKNYIKLLHEYVKTSKGIVKNIRVVKKKKFEVTPTIVCLNDDGIPHYTTVMDVVNYKPNSENQINSECRIVTNDGGGQYIETCTAFAKKAKMALDSAFDVDTYFAKKSCGVFSIYFLADDQL